MSQPILPDTRVRKRGLFTGRVENLFVEEGVLFHNKDIVHKADFSSQRQLTPQLIIALPLESKALMRYGQRHELKGCRYEKSAPVTATAIYYAQPDLVEGAAKAYVRSRSIVISMSLTWVDSKLKTKDKIAFERAFSTHLTRFDWSLPLHLGQLAEALNLTSSHSQSEAMLREAFVLSVWDNLLTQLKQQPLATSDKEQTQSTRLKVYLRDETTEGKTLTDIAQDLGMSLSTLQRTARKELGMSLNRYLRERKLHQAKELLEQKHISIREAASVAGYNHSANFITAYRKLFGDSPKHAMRELPNTDVELLR